nr:bifunctional 23S rRNA (guanine(2069)-N(7))-methyltransferase RlmK/23S rRNA (guanine(2445)-N(2))-methyltransferase RlmL [Catenovulum sediminis]
MYRREWGFDAWLGHNAKLFESIKNEYDQLIDNDKTLRVFGYDISNRELTIARQNAMDAGVTEQIHFERADATQFAINLNAEQGYVVSNPPYGERLEDEIKIANLYLDFGQSLKINHAGWHLTVISSALEQMRQLKLKADKKYKVKNGALDCVIANYQIEEAVEAGDPRERIATEFQNRLRKNHKQFSKLAKQYPTECYRVYDADLPNYNVAVDIYGDHLVVQEYAAPKDIPFEKTQARLNDVLLTAPKVLTMDPAKVAVKVRKRQKGKEQYKKAAQTEQYMVVQEANAQFYVNLYDYLDTGLFIDHRDMRLKVQQNAKGKTVLNLFAYTCSVSVHAALGGASQITSVDLSKKYLEWGKRNFELNNINPTWHPFIAMDSIEWLQRNKNKFDLIFIDPPSFSNSKKLDKDFDVQRDHIKLLSLALEHLNPGGQLYFSNNLRSFKLDEEALRALNVKWLDLSQQTLPFDFKRRSNIRQVWALEANE